MTPEEREAVRSRYNLGDKTLEELREMAANVPLDTYELEVVNDEIRSAEYDDGEA